MSFIKVIHESEATGELKEGTMDEASVRRRDIDALREAGLSERDVLLIATAVACHNFAMRMAVPFDVLPPLGA
jgi:hypothetical protein